MFGDCNQLGSGLKKIHRLISYCNNKKGVVIIFEILMNKVSRFFFIGNVEWEPGDELKG